MSGRRYPSQSRSAKNHTGNNRHPFYGHLMPQALVGYYCLWCAFSQLRLKLLNTSNYKMNINSHTSECMRCQFVHLRACTHTRKVKEHFNKGYGIKPQISFTEGVSGGLHLLNWCHHLRWEPYLSNYQQRWSVYVYLKLITSVRFNGS